MIKGKSKIQLFDAKTGSVVSEQTNCNMVTNALETIAGCKDTLGLLRWWRDVSSTNGTQVTGTPAFAMMPPVTRAMGGLLLWSENISEDPSITNVPAGVDEVGHAGGEYGGSDIYRGSYNTNESGKISGGYRHVWDFATDKANGIVKCLSLTSQTGGNVGWHGCFDGNNYSLFNYCYFHTSNTYVCASHANQYIDVPGGTAGRIFYIQKQADGTLKLFKRYGTRVWTFIVGDPSKVTLTMSAPSLTQGDELITLDDNYSTLYVYQGKMHEITPTSTTSITHKIFSLSGEQESSITIALPFSLSNFYNLYANIYRDGYYYCTNASDGTIKKITPQGELAASIPANGNVLYLVNPIIDEHSGNIIMAGRDNSPSTSSTMNFPFVITSGDNAAFLAKSPYSPYTAYTYNDSNLFLGQFVKTDDMRSPFMFFSDGCYGCRFIPLINMAYLATINNLQTPIVKTSAQTMKITYEIYDE